MLEGPEGVGKTTQVAALLRALPGAEAFREPGGTPLGNEIRTLLLTPDDVKIGARAEALLFMAARAQLVERIESRLAVGVTVILDRFFLSTYAYQIVGRGLPVEEVRRANALAVGDLRPDLTVLLSCDLEVARTRMVARGDLDRMEREGPDFHARVTAAFLAAADPAWQAAHPEVGPVARVDASGPPAQVTGRIVDLLAARWPETFRSLAESQYSGPLSSSSPG
nr:dTMP kinase [Roseisolibacter sp. H3M3-2]